MFNISHSRKRGRGFDGKVDGCFEDARPAEYEWWEISNRTRAAKEVLAKRGVMPGGVGRGIYGFDYDPEMRRMVVNDVEALVLVRAFRKVDEGATPSRVARLFNAEGIPAKGGGKWCYRSAQRALTNEVCIGEYWYGRTRTGRGADGRPVRVEVPKEEWHRIPGFAPAIVPKDLFWRVQEKLGTIGPRGEGGVSA